MLEKLEMIIMRKGIMTQKQKAIEELGELIVALAKDSDLYNITEEIADVEIMLTQLKMIYDNEEEVENIKEYKIERLLNNV